MSLSEAEKKVFLEVVEIASDLMARRICVDYDLSPHIPLREDRAALVKQAYERNGDPENFDPGKDHPPSIYSSTGRTAMPHWRLLKFLSEKALEP